MKVGLESIQSNRSAVHVVRLVEGHEGQRLASVIILCYGLAYKIKTLAYIEFMINSNILL